MSSDLHGLPLLLGAMAMVIGPSSAAAAKPAAGADAAVIAALDTAYQAAVKRNDADAMAQILHPDFVLVLGDGTRVSRERLLAQTRAGTFVFDQQDEDAGTQQVLVLGRHRRGHRTAMVAGPPGRRRVRPAAVVQRHLCADPARLALCLWPGVAAPRTGLTWYRRPR